MANWSRLHARAHRLTRLAGAACLLLTGTAGGAAMGATAGAEASAVRGVVTGSTPVAAVGTRPEPVNGHRLLVDAAVAEAAERLLAQVLRLSLAPRVDGERPESVGSVVARLGPDALPRLREHLRGAQQIGGPRILGRGHVQVHLQMTGAAVLDALADLAVAAPGLGLTREALSERAQRWEERTFIGTGTSVSPEVARRVLPRGEAQRRVWVGVDEEATRRAIDAARTDAADRVVVAVRAVVVLQAVPTEPHRPVPAESTADEPSVASTPEAASPVAPAGVLLSVDLDGDAATTLGDVFDLGSVGADAHRWLLDRPVTRVRFLEDRVVEVKLSVDPGVWVEQIRTSLDALPAGLPVLSDAQWARIAAEVTALLPEPVGRAVAVEGGALVPGEPALGGPPHRPAWTMTPLTAEAVAPSGGSALLTARDAEALARQNLSGRLNALRVSPGLTLADLAGRDARARRLLEDALRRAPLSLVEYRGDGSVLVRVTLDTRSVWEALLRLP